jgi:hypothetical protein
MTDLEPAPENVLRFIRCNCKISKNNACGTNVCTCRKNGLICVSACGGCYGVDCENSTYESEEEEEDDDGNIFDLLENEI